MKNLKHLNKYFWKYRGRLFIGFFFIVAGNVFSVYAPVIVRDGIDFLASSLEASRSFSDGNSSAEIAQPQSFKTIGSWFGQTLENITLRPDDFAGVVTRIAILLAAAYIIFFLLKGVFLFFQRQALIVMSRYIEYDLKNEVYDKYQQLDLTFYKQNRTGDLMNRISEDVNRVRMYLGPAVMYILNLITLFLMSIIVMLQIDVELTLYTLAPLPFMMVAIFYVSTMINRKSEKVQAQQSKLSAIVQETMSGIRVLKGFGREDFYAQTFSNESDDYKKKQLGLVRIDAFFMPVIILLVGLSTILTVYVGAHKVMRGEISPGVIVQFVFYVNILTWPFAIVGWVTSLVQKAEASQERINEFLHINPDIKNTADASSEIVGDIQFNNVSYTYADSGIEAIKDLSIHIKQGEIVGIIGRTGSGKSTLAQLLMRMIDPGSGSILIDGKNARDHDLDNLRKSIGYVPQEVFLFSDTVANNIAFGKPLASMDEVVEAAKNADIHDNIMAFPLEYQTQLGERGINLSGGQKQRLSIARAIVKNPKVLLFDDCLSAVDVETEERILKSLAVVMQKKTSVIIAHRISSIRHADRIIVMEQGSIIEEGSHEQLFALNGAYASLYRKQQLEYTQHD